MQYVLWGALALAIRLLGLAWRERRLRQRRDLLQQILDLADAFERELLDCRKQLRAMSSLTAADRPRTGTPASSLDAVEPHIEASLRDLLAHRIWIRNQAAQASLAELGAARDALAKAQAALQAQRARLAEAQADLDGVREALATIAQATRR